MECSKSTIILVHLYDDYIIQPLRASRQAEFNIESKRPRGILYRFAYCIRDARHHCIPPTNLRKACQKIGEIRPKICQNTSPNLSKWTSLKVSLVSWTVLGVPKSQDESRFRSEARTIFFSALFLTILSENGPEMGVPFFR